MIIDDKIREQLAITIAEAIGRLNGSQPEDIVESIEFPSPTSMRSQLTAEFGIRSFFTLQSSLRENSAAFQTLRTYVDESKTFPNWMGTKFRSSKLVLATLVTQLAMACWDSKGSITPTQAADRWCRTIDSKQIELTFTAYLSNGTNIPVDLDIKFSNGVQLRYVPNEELAKVHKSYSHSLNSYYLNQYRSALEVRLITSFVFEPNPDSKHSELYGELQQKIHDVHVAIHCYQSGSTRIDLQQLCPSDSLFGGPILTMIPPSTLGSMYDFNKIDRLKLSQFVDNCLFPCGASLSLATKRLQEAESRSSPLDAIVDSFIGIEALLNSENSSELTMRVALNYSMLCNQSDRHHSYRRMKDLYKIRSRIVHGDYSGDKQYKVAGEKLSIQEIAVLSKATLREVIFRLVNDEHLRNVKYDTEFWEARYFSSSVS